MRYTDKKDDGYILLLAMLVTSILLAISFSVYAIGIKEVIIASFLHNSQRALSASDRGVECALYWDDAYRLTPLLGTIFRNTDPAFDMPSNAINTAVCDGKQIMDPNPDTQHWVVDTSGLSNPTPVVVTTFHLKFSNDTPETCADVTVSKTASEIRVTSDGYSDCNTGNFRRTQRTIEVISQF